MNANQMTTAKQQPRFSVAIRTKSYQDMINNTLSDPARAARFVASITSAVAATPALQTTTPASILACGLLGESLNLSPSPQLGQYYLVPFKQKAKYDRQGNLIAPERSTATFIIGYRGLIQLAIRSGQYKKLNVLEIKEGELVGFDPLNEEIEVNLIQDFEEREAAPTVGYYAMFEYTNGFRKALYWSKQKMLSHAGHYSKAFSKQAYEKIQRGEIPERDMWKYYSFWYGDFDAMAKKTMLRQLISKWGVMSTEMQTAMASDNTTVEMQDHDFVTTPVDEVPMEDPTLEEPEAEEPEEVKLGDL